MTIQSAYSPFLVPTQVRPHLPCSSSRNILNILTFSPKAHTPLDHSCSWIASGCTEWRQNASVAPQGALLSWESPVLPLSLPNRLWSCNFCLSCPRSEQRSSCWSRPASWYLSNCSCASFQFPFSCTYTCWAGDPRVQVCPWDVTQVILASGTAASRLPLSSRTARRLTFLLDTPFNDSWGSRLSFPRMTFVLISVEKKTGEEMDSALNQLVTHVAYLAFLKDNC